MIYVKQLISLNGVRTRITSQKDKDTFYCVHTNEFLIPLKHQLLMKKISTIDEEKEIKFYYENNKSFEKERKEYSLNGFLDYIFETIKKKIEDAIINKKSPESYKVILSDQNSEVLNFKQLDIKNKVNHIIKLITVLSTRKYFTYGNHGYFLKRTFDKVKSFELIYQSPTGFFEKIIKVF